MGGRREREKREGGSKGRCIERREVGKDRNKQENVKHDKKVVRRGSNRELAGRGGKIERGGGTRKRG